MSKPTAIFSYSPVRSVRSSPSSSSRNNGSSSKTRTQQTTSAVTESSPRKCRIQTEIKSSPAGARGTTNINVKSRFQITEMTSRMNKERLGANPSPRIEESKKQTSGSKLYSVAGVVKLQNGRDNKSTVRKGLFDGTTECSEVPSNVNVKTMRTCFERKENKVPARPPPSPSPSRAKPQAPNPRNNNNLKGILSSRSRFDQASPSRFRVPSSPSNNTPTPQKQNKLRRSASTSTLAAAAGSPSVPGLLRSHSQLAMTPKHRVRFQDETTPGCFSPVLLDQGSSDSVAGETTNLTVAVRLRPTFHGERSVISVDRGSVKVRSLGAEHCFSYDYCFDSSSDQQEVFDTMVHPLVEAAFHSYNVCLFAYGQTGSGKSYSMMGEETLSIDNLPEKAGIIPRFSQEIFKRVENSKEYLSTQIEISYFEIYNEKIHDLLRPAGENGRAAPLRVREHPELGPYVVDLTVRRVNSFKSLQEWLRAGNSHKAKAATEMNVNSSRSHSIFTITLTQLQDDDQPSICSKINLVDLAGSERLAHTSASGDRLKEGVSINRSLLTLGKVISSLAENKRGGFIPYRESVLTWLLRESLGGNSHTAMLATVSPSSQYVEETLSTLRYACQARNIVNTVRINECPQENRIRELTEEIQRLKESFPSVDHGECEQKMMVLQEQLDRTKSDLDKAKTFCKESEKEVLKLEREWAKTQALNFHEDCDRKIQDLENELLKSENQNKSLDREIRELRKDCLVDKESKFEHEIELRQLKETLDDMNKIKACDKEEMCRVKNELEKCKKENNLLKTENKQLERDIYDYSQKNINYERENNQLRSENKQLERDLYDYSEKNSNYERENNQLRSENKQLEKDIYDYSEKNSNYERDISEMKLNMIEIKKNLNHDQCESQVLMLQTALSEAERYSNKYKEKFHILETKCSEMTSLSNHEGCEKEISALKETIKELKQFADHQNCDQVIEKLKTSLTGADKMVSDLQNEVSKVKEESLQLEAIKERNMKEILRLKSESSQLEKAASQAEKIVSDLTDKVSKFNEENSKLEATKEKNLREILSLKNKCSQLEKTSSHVECEEKLDTLRKALAVSKSRNVHVQCENRISELELEVQNLQSVDHTKCEEKIDGLFYAVEKYADDYSKLAEKHKEDINKHADEKIKLLKQHEKDINQYEETVKKLEEKISMMNAEMEVKKNIKNNRHDLVYLESQLRSAKDENSKLKKKKVEDEKRISSLEEQVISLTKELLDVKNQLRASVREKESNESLCAQLQEQLSQQDRKLAQTQISSNFEEDKENWETPSKVIRRSIAQYSKSKRSVRCSFALRAEEIHQSLKDAEDICSRLKIPWVFQLEPEVTTHSWFDVNVRVWDQRTMSSVRWPQDVFLGWLREIKDTILSKSRGHKLFHSANWMQSSRDPEPLPLEPVPGNKQPLLEEEVECLRGKILALERLVNSEDKHEALTAVTSLGKAVTQLSSQLGLSSPVKTSGSSAARRRL